MASKSDPVAWLKALTRAALPGTVRVEVTYARPSPNEVKYALTCYDETDNPIGDDRDYEILKAVMGPIEKLCSCEGMPLTVELKIDENELNFKNSV